MPVLPDTAILGCREQNFVWILIRYARQLLFAASHSSMAKQSLNLVARGNSSGHTGKIGRPSSGRLGVQRGLAFRRILCILVHECVQLTVQPYKATQIIPPRVSHAGTKRGTVFELSCDCHRFFNSASVDDCSGINGRQQ